MCMHSVQLITDISYSNCILAQRLTENKKGSIEYKSRNGSFTCAMHVVHNNRAKTQEGHGQSGRKDKMRIRRGEQEWP